MATPIKRLKIDVRKLDKAHFFEGKTNSAGHTPLYADLTLWDNGKVSEYGDDGYISQDASKEARERGEKGPIVGNSKPIKAKVAAPAPAPVAASSFDDSDVPF